jgi:S-adenosylmethionine hydrolase
MTTLTLTTDFGTKDGFIGTMKGVIWNICPDVHIADISHAISPQNILEGALTLRRAYTYFAPGTVHVAVIDPGVGTYRRPIAARLGSHYFVVPDNGLLTPMLEDADENHWPVEIVHTTNEKYFLPEISRTFHGRDIFAPVGAHLANGVPLSNLGPAISDPIRMVLPHPEKTSNGWHAHVMIVDVFGNLATDLPAAALQDFPHVSFHIRDREVHGLVASYGQKQPGDLVALIDSENHVEIAVVNGSAAKLTGARVGDVVDVIIRQII